MGLYNNVPTFTYISATGITVSYNNKVYTVQSFYTNKKYIYWDSDNGTVLQASNTMPTRSAKVHLVLINDNGIVTTVPSTSENFEISYDGDSDDAIKSRIYALYEKDRELGDKYVAIEQDVNGIKQIVGSSDGKEGTIIDRVSVIEQRADKIDLLVSENKKEYDDDKALAQLRDDVNSSIIKLNANLGTLSSLLQDCYKDDEITSEEKISIQESINILENSKADVIAYVDIIKKTCDISDFSLLTNVVTDLNTAHMSLVQNINIAISDNTVVPTEKTVIIDAIAKYNLKINLLKNTCDDIIFLGIGGVITEKLAEITMKSNEIKLSVSSVEKEVSNQKENFEKEFEDVNGRLDSLDIVLDGTFENNVLDQAERKMLEQNITELKKQKADVDIEYQDLYNSPYLDGTLKANYENCYNNFVEKYDSLLNIINGILEKEDLINDDDRTNVDNAHDNLATSINEFITLSNSVMEYITEAREKEINDRFDKEVGDLNDRVDNVVIDMNGALRDDIIDQAERKVLLDGLNDLEIQKNDVITQYDNLFNDFNFSNSDLRRSLRAAYEDFLAKCNNLVDNIEYLLNKEDLITDEDRSAYQVAYDEYKEATNLFSEEFYKASESVTEKLLNDIKTDFNKEISDLNNAVSDLDETMNGIFKDGILSDAEKISIREQLAALEREKADIDANHNVVIKNTFLSSTAKSSLTASYTSYSSAYTNLINVVNGILNSTSIISTNQQNAYKNALVNYRGKLSSYSEKLRNALDDITTNGINNAKEELQGEISDVLKSLGDLETNMNEAFRDGVISDAEKTSIKQHLQTLKNEKSDIDTQYTTLYSNTDLVDSTTSKPKSELKTAYNNFVTKYNTLVTTINNIIDKTTLVTNTDRTNLETAMTNYRTASSTYMTKATNAIDSIAAKKATDQSATVDKKYADIILSEDGIVNQVGQIQGQLKDNEEDIDKLYSQVSTVEQSVDNLKISFSESGGYNLIRNSAGYGGTSGWLASNGSVSIGTTTSTKNINKILLRLSNNTTSESFAYCTRFSLTAGKKYTLSFNGYVNANAKSMDVYVLGSKTIAHNDFSQNTKYDTVIASKTGITGGYTTYTITFTVPTDIISGVIRFDNNSAVTSGTNGYVYWADLQLEQGEVATRWTPHPEEVYSGITTIDKDGIKVSQSNYSGYTQMKADGFYVNNGSENVISVTSSGATFKGKVTIQSGSTVPTGTLSGTISNDQLHQDIKNNISNAQSTADSAKQDAATANSKLGEIASDNKLTASEKQSVKLEWDKIVGEKDKIVADATRYSQSSTTYVSKYNTLNTYITPLLSNLTTTSDIVGTTFRSHFTNYYNARQDLLNTISAAAKKLSDDAQSTANTAKDNAAAAQSTANTAKENAATANSKLSEMANDNKLTALEKQSIKLEWDKIVGEKDKIVADATTYGKSSTTYVNKYNTLNTYITPLLSNLTTTSDITGSTFRSHFTNYYNARQDLLNTISAAAKKLADDAQSTADTAQSTANAAQSTLTNNKDNWSNAFNRVKDWAYGAVTGKTTIDGGLIQTNTILANHIAAGEITANHISSKTLTGVTIKNDAGTFVVNPSGSITIGSTSSYRTYITNTGMTFNDSSGYYYSKLSAGRFYFTDNNGSNVGHVGRSVWNGTSTYLSAFNGDYGHTVAIGTKQTSTTSTYTCSLIDSSTDQYTGGVYMKQGINLINPRVASPVFIPTGQNWTGGYYPMITGGNSDYGYALNLYGTGRIWLGIRNSFYNGGAIEIRGNSTAVNYTDLHFWSHIDMHGFNISNGSLKSVLDAQSSTTYSLMESGSLEMDIYSPYTFTENELRYVCREAVHTTEEFDYNDNGEYVSTGRYLCYCEIPIFMAENMELNYHINISKLSFGDYRIIEKDPYYFIVESEKDNFSFTYEVVGKQIDKARNNAIVANYGVEKEEVVEEKRLEYEMN